MLLRHGLVGVGHTAAAAGGLTREQGAERLSSGTNATSYDSTTYGGGTWTANTTGSNRLMVFVICCLTPATLPTSISMTFGSQSGTELFEDVTVNASRGTVAVFYIKDADIPTGAQDVTVTMGTSNTRACSVYVAEYSGVDQTTPFGTPATQTWSSTGTPSQTVTVGTTGSAVLSSSSMRADTTTQLPISANQGTVVWSGNTGLSSATDTTHCFVEELNVSSGSQTHTHTYSGPEDPVAIWVVEMNEA